VVLANINSQLAALQTHVTANANTLSATNGQIANLNAQIGTAINAANAAANATALTTARLNNLIATLITQENNILAAMIAAGPPVDALVPTQQALIAALTTLNVPFNG